MCSFFLTNPAAATAREIENIVILEKNTVHPVLKTACIVWARLISVTVFPIFVLLELVFKHIPQMIIAYNDEKEWNHKVEKVWRDVLGIVLSPLGLVAPEGISGFFLKSAPSNAIRPFGVERIYTIEMETIHYPETVEQVQALVQRANREKKQISLIGAGMSQGTQTLPVDANQMVINLKNIHHTRISDDRQTCFVGAGATWEQHQIALNDQGLSTIVKQASNPFSIGGTIGMNGHGWAHEQGSIASTVASLKIINAQGEIQILTPEDELFGCMFGTMGYFGIVVEAELKILPNTPLIERTEEIDLNHFHAYYQEHIKGKGFPLFGGRLVLDGQGGNPLRKACMVRYERVPGNQEPQVTPNYASEAHEGTALQRIGLRMVSQLPDWIAKHITTIFWNQERADMLQGRELTRNEALQPPINAFNMFHHSNLHGQWLQEYFIKPENLPNFLRFLGAQLNAYGVRINNGTVRPTPKDPISVLPYAEQDRYAVVICFAQKKSQEEIARTEQWIKTVTEYLASQGDKYYQAYMPFATREQFEECYGKEIVDRMRDLKEKYDPHHRFGNQHTKKYYDRV